MAKQEKPARQALGALTLNVDLEANRGRRQEDPVLGELRELLKESKANNQTMGVPWNAISSRDKDHAMGIIRRVANKAGYGCIVRAVADDDSLVAFKAVEKRGYQTR